MSENKNIPSTLDWVKVRSACSIFQVFSELELGVRQDVEHMQSLVKANQNIAFSFAKGSIRRFSVTRVDDPLMSIGESIYFDCTGKEISVSGETATGEKKMLVAELTLTNDGECKLKVGDQELYQWQFRRMALERLFFGPQKVESRVVNL
jgi:hypothetical protein